MVVELKTDKGSTVRPSAPNGESVPSNSAFGPFTPPQSIMDLQEPSVLSLMTLRFSNLQDVDRDERYLRTYYSGAAPHEIVLEESRSIAYPLFDRYDAQRSLELLGDTHTLAPQDLETLKGLLYQRAYGEFSWQQWRGIATTSDEATTRLFTRYTPSQIDRAIAQATSINEREGIRVMPYRSRSESGFINPEVVPSGPIIAVKGNLAISPQEETSSLSTRIAKLLTVQPDQRTTDGTILLSDIHALGPNNESELFKKMVDKLRGSPPARLLLGGDIIDSPGFQNRFGHLSPEEQRSQRKSEILERVEMLRQALPNTEILLHVGNHDLPRLARLPLQPKFNAIKICGVELNRHELPQIQLLRGRLPIDWLEDFKTNLLKAIHDKRAEGSEIQDTKPLQEMTDERILGLARKVFLIKGIQDSAIGLSGFSYYDESFGAEVYSEAKKLGVEQIGKRCDKYFLVDLGKAEAPVIFLVSHEPQEMGPNLCRMILSKDTVYGGSTKFPDGVRGVISFDQHVAGSVLMDIHGAPFSVHLVGSLTPNSNPGQRLMCAVVDPESGNLYHLTLDGGEGTIEAPRLADYRQINYLQPTDLKPDRPSSLTSTTKPRSEVIDFDMECTLE